MQGETACSTLCTAHFFGISEAFYSMYDLALKST